MARPAPRVPTSPGPDPSRVATMACLRAADALGLSGRALADVLGVSEATLSRLRSGTARLQAGQKPFELAVLFVRMFRSLDAILGGDQTAARAWMAAPNLALGGVPKDMIGTVTGLIDVIEYLDSRRAVL